MLDLSPPESSSHISSTPTERRMSRVSHRRHSVTIAVCWLLYCYTGYLPGKFCSLQALRIHSNNLFFKWTRQYSSTRTTRFQMAMKIADHQYCRIGAIQYVANLKHVIR